MFVLICITTIQIVVVVNGRELTTFGEDVSGNYLATSKHLYAIPFTTRSTEVAFPDVCNQCGIYYILSVIILMFTGFYDNQSK